MGDLGGSLSNQALGHIKDIRAAMSAGPNIKHTAYLQGHVWKVRHFGKTTFIDITDGTGAIQIVCDKQKSRIPSSHKTYCATFYLHIAMT